MPFQSTAQQRFAFGTNQPWAKRWARETDFAKLPRRVRKKIKDAATTAGPTLHGPGGILGTPGMGGRKWGNRRKDTNCTCGVVTKGEQIAPGITRIRGNLCNVHGRYGPCDASLSKKPKGGKGGKGKKPKAPTATPEQRAQARMAEQIENRSAVDKTLGLMEDTAGALDDLRAGKPVDDDGGLVKLGLAEQAADGSYRLTPAGRALVAARNAGDAGRARDVMSGAKDRYDARQARQNAATARGISAAMRRGATPAKGITAGEKKPPAGGGGKGKKGGGAGGGGGGGGGADSADRIIERQQRERERQEDRKTRERERLEDRATRERERQEDRARQQQERAEDRQLALEERRAMLAERRGASGRVSPNRVPLRLPRTGRQPNATLAKTKAQSAQDKAMFAKMGGGGSGGGKGGGGGGTSTLWPKNPKTGKREPQVGESKARPADPGRPARGQTVGNQTKAYGADPTTSYSMRHELVDMGSIQASNTASGGINPKYDPALQPRDRSRASSQAQIAEVAQKMNPDVMVTDFHRIDAGTPIIDAHGNVLSGNGRTLALQRAAELHPDKHADYKAAIKAQAREAGIDPAMVDKMQNPVLVRRLAPGTDTAAFAREANSSGTLRMSPLEQAKVDAHTISNAHMLKFHAEDGVDIDRALRSKANKPFVDEFLGTVPANERANLLTRNGELNQMGLYRMKAAVYTRAFPGAAGERMAESMLESLDPDVKQIQNGISGGLPALTRAQALIRGGHREQNLDISDDLAKTIDVYARIKDNPALTAGTPANKLVAKYLSQSNMFGRELNDEQERLLVHVDSMSRSPARVRSFLERYARIVENEAQPGQSGLFGDVTNLTRAQLFDALLAEDSATKAAMKAKRPRQLTAFPLPPVRRRADYSDITPGDLVMALFHDRIAPRDAMSVSGERAQAHADGVPDAPPEDRRNKSFTVFKDDTDAWRWVARTTTAYRDRDGEIITTKALEDDAARMTATKQYGPLRYWHIGNPDPLHPTAPWGVGLDIGTCDYSIVIGRTSIESGTFTSPSIGAAFAQSADDYELSPGFFHPPSDPDPAGEYHTIRRFERSVVPVAYGRASNLFTGMTVKEHRMDQQTYDARVKAFLEDMNKKGVPEHAAAAALSGMEQADKSAKQQGIAFKSEERDADPWSTVVAALKAALAPAQDTTTTTTKADDDGEVAEVVEEMADDGGEMEEEEAEYVGDMAPAAFRALLIDAFSEAITQFGSGISGKMSEMDDALKAMGYARMKSDQAAQSTAAEVAQLKARLAQLEGDQPAVVVPADIEAALKGAPQAPPDPNAPQIPADATPVQALAMRTMPNLYQTNGQGSFAGWTPPAPSPS